MIEVKRVTKQELDTSIEDKTTEGYKIESKTSTQAILIKRSLGKPFWHIIIFLLTFWFTLGLFNFVYALYSYFIKFDKIIIKIKK